MIVTDGQRKPRYFKRFPIQNLKSKMVLRLRLVDFLHIAVLAYVSIPVGVRYVPYTLRHNFVPHLSGNRYSIIPLIGIKSQ